LMLLFVYMSLLLLCKYLLHKVEQKDVFVRWTVIVCKSSFRLLTWYVCFLVLSKQYFISLVEKQ